MASGVSGDTEKQAAMRVMEMDNKWYEGKEWETPYLPKDEAVKIENYCVQFWQFPDYKICPLTRNQRRHIRTSLRKKHGYTVEQTTSIKQPGIPGKEE